MSKGYMILIVDEPPEFADIDDMPATVFMRFHEPPADDYLKRIADANPGKRIYSLSGASMWFRTSDDKARVE